MDTNLYDILQVAPHAEPEVIESAYKRLARKYHPDANPAPEAHERMKAINHAYQVLGDPLERVRYDRKRANTRGVSAKPTKRQKTESTSRRGTTSTPPSYPRKQSVQEAIAVNETHIASAIELLKKTSVLTSTLLQRLLHISYPRAVHLFAILIERGIIDDSGQRIASASQKNAESFEYSIKPTPQT